MGQIRVGQKKQGTYRSTGFSTVANKAEETPKPAAMSKESKDKLMEKIMSLLEAERVAAMRDNGLSDEADKYETFLAEEHLREINEENRKKRLAEIETLSEEERLPLLIEEGFEEEAKELSEKLSKKEEGKEEKANEENAPVAEVKKSQKQQSKKK